MNGIHHARTLGFVEVVRDMSSSADWHGQSCCLKHCRCMPYVPETAIFVWPLATDHAALGLRESVILRSPAGDGRACPG